MGDIEKRVAALEAKVAAIEERRAKLIPPELANDPNVIELCADHVKNAVAGWKLCLHENGVNLAQAKFMESVSQVLRELEQKSKEEKQREGAEIAAAIEYYERTGESPPGYIIEDPECRKSF